MSLMGSGITKLIQNINSLVNRQNIHLQIEFGSVLWIKIINPYKMTLIESIWYIVSGLL